MDLAFRSAVVRARQHGELFFAGLISEENIHRALGNARLVWRGWIYTPAVTVWVFLAQCLSQDHSCREAVAQWITWLLARGQKPCSPDTGANCTARDHLPEEACQKLVQDTGRQVDEEAPKEWRWLGRRVLDVDGSTITLPDTEANQAEYPQQLGQLPGVGLPIARILVVFSLAVGTVLDAALAKYKGKETGENSLFRTLHNTLEHGDVVLVDRYFSGWFDIALVHQRRCDVVVRKHQLRPTDFRTGLRLGKDDHIVCWAKPQRPDWMTQEQYDTLPDDLTVREVRVRVEQKGFRTKSLIVVTTLLDATKYSATEIAKLYRRRWQAELNLRSIKIVLQMDHLRCKTPHRVRNEFFMHLLAYNLIRKTMAIAAVRADVEPWTIRFKGTLQTATKLLPLLASDMSTEEWCTALLDAIETHVVGDRPDRFEPRVKKRRPKPYDLMNQPRQHYKRQIA
jgi:hypothetical protein